MIRACLWLPLGLLDRLRAAARARGVNLSEYVRAALFDHLDREPASAASGSPRNA